ncbi:MAG: T9SS type A sorting domain-containing protein [Winogradskyella sp.]|nr:T9SS type A sorting domain-containing protein [Winogradskyella sp.]
MKKLYFLLFTLLIASVSFSQATGDIAFVGFNADGDDDFAIVALADISASTTIYFTDNESDGMGGFTSGEGQLEWTTPGTVIPAGTVITFTDTDSDGNANYGVSIGTLADIGAGGLNLSGNGDAIFAYIGTDEVTPTTFLAGAQNTTSASAYGDLTGTNLTIGSTFVIFTASGTPDGAVYTGPRDTLADFSDYLSLIGSAGNWDTTTGSSNGELILPFDTTAFEESASAMPTISITAPSDGALINSGTTSVDLEWSTFNTDGSEFVSVNVNGNVTTPANSPFAITTMDGQTYNVTVQLLNPGGVLDTQMITFSVAFPCTLSIDNTVETCDSINEGTGDTYNTVVSFSGAGNSTYTIDTGGVGTVVDGANLNTMATGTFSITGIPENTNVVINIVGDVANSGCDFNTFVSSPICDPQLQLPFTENFEYGITAGDLTAVSAGEWENHSGTIAVQYSENSIVLNGYDARASFGGSAVLSPSNSEDVNLPFTEQTSGKVYMSALVKVSVVNGTNYFWHFNSSGFLGKIGAKSDGGTGINFGIGAAGSPQFGSTSYVLNTTYLLVASFDIATGKADLHVLTAPIGTEPTTPEATDTDAGQIGSSVSAVAFRQSGGIANVTLDGVRVAKTWSNLSLSNNDFDTREFSIFPNPTNTGDVTISSVNATPIAVTVFDILGKQVKTETISNNRLDVSNLKSGIYLLRLTQDGATSTKKLVIR